jgi:AAA domain-containing protein
LKKQYLTTLITLCSLKLESLGELIECPKSGLPNRVHNSLILQAEYHINRLSEKAYFVGRMALWHQITRIPNKPHAHVYAALARSRSVFHTPTVGGTLRALRQDLERMTTRVDICIKQDEKTDRDGKRFGSQDSMVELIIIDEAERLSTAAVEYLRDMFDRTTIGLMFIGMPGIEKRLARYPQLYSRVGFAHHYRPLQGDELTFVLTRHWRKLGLSLDSADFTDTQAIAAISRITHGNFRLLHRLFMQIERILRINELRVITEEVVEAARSTLVIGAT